jgi:SAM-dependent methyltransferase
MKSMGRQPAKDSFLEGAEARYAREREQGETIVAHDLERVWGWSSPAGRVRATRRARFLIDAAGLSPSVTCLELGAGTGEFSVRLLESECDLVAIELSEAAAGVCRRRVGSRGEVVLGNVETGEGIEGRSFDAVVGVSVLHHVDVDACLRTILAVLRPGGRFAFTEPNMANPQVWAERHLDAVRRRRHVTPHETAFRPRQLTAAFERAGLVVETCEPFDFLHPATPRFLIGAVSRLGVLLEKFPGAREIAGSIRIAGRRP